jgi:hypothetical protein
MMPRPRNTDQAVYARCVREARKASKVVADSDLRCIAFQTLLKHLLETRIRWRKLRKRQHGAKSLEPRSGE